jgi:hypothetical protein
LVHQLPIKPPGRKCHRQTNPDHIVGSRPILCGILAVIDEEIKALKWKLWHGRVERGICALEKIIVDMDELGRQGDFSAARLNSLGQQLLTYIRSNRSALVDYGARYRAGRRVSTNLAESAVNSLVAKRMVKCSCCYFEAKAASSRIKSHAADIVSYRLTGRIILFDPLP